MADKNLNINIVAKDKSRQALSKVQGRLNSVKQSVFSLKGALIGIGAGAVIKSFVDVGREVESLGVRFKFLFGSAEEGSKAFDNLTKFAGKVPFSLEAISRASGNLAVVAKDADDLNRILEITGNVAAVTGLDFETTASQIQRSFAGGIASADIFREKGVRSLLGFKEGAKVSVDETVEAFEKAFSGDGRFANATKDLAQTLDGTLSMIGDKYFNFQKTVAEGFFDELKGEFGDLNKFLEDNEKQIEDIATAIGENFAGSLLRTTDVLKKVAPAVKNIADALGTTIQGFASLPPFVQNVGLIGALLFGKKGAIAVSAISFLVGEIRNLMDEAKQIGEIEFGNSETIEELNAELKVLRQNYLDIIEAMRPDGENEISDSMFEVLQSTLNDVIQDMSDVENKIKKINFGKKLAEEYGAFGSVIADARNQIVHTHEDLKEMTRDMNRAILHGTELGEHMQNALEGLGDTTTKEVEVALSSFERFKKGFHDAMNENIFDGFQKAGETAFNSLKSTLTDFVITGKLNMKSFGDAIKRALVEALIGQAVQFALDKSLDMFKMNTIKRALMSVYEGALATFKAIPFPFNILAVGGAISFGMGLVNKIRGFADGGRPPVGRTSLVGERGPELFVPDSAGTIVPNDQLGGGSTTVNFNITTVDAKGFNELLVNSRGMIVNLINTAVNEKGKPALI